jgi:hypothetical protein
MNPNQYPLNERDKTRIKPLIHQVQENVLEFRYLITIAYWYTNKDYAKCIADAHKTRRVLRDFFKSDIRCWFFVEKHTDPNQKNYGGFHLHALAEDPSDRWENLTERQKHWIGHPKSPTPSEGTEALAGVTPSAQQKTDLIRNVVQRLQKKTVAQGSRGVDVREIYDLEPCLAYCSKQFERFLPSHEVIAAPSDIDFRFFLTYKQNGLQYTPRFQSGILERSPGTLRSALRA